MVTDWRNRLGIHSMEWLGFSEKGKYLQSSGSSDVESSGVTLSRRSSLCPMDAYRWMNAEMRLGCALRALLPRIAASWLRLLTKQNVERRGLERLVMWQLLKYNVRSCASIFSYFPINCSTNCPQNKPQRPSDKYSE